MTLYARDDTDSATVNSSLLVDLKKKNVVRGWKISYRERMKSELMGVKPRQNISVMQNRRER